MAINWFPGHMHKARKEIKQIMPQVDLVIEVLDARIPFSSENPLVASLRGETPSLKILNKSDLADPAVTARWLQYLEQEKGVRAIALTQKQPAEVQRVLALCRGMLAHRNMEHRTLRALILGIPNVGKSTLINTLAGRTIAKTGNEPAVTKMQQRIQLPDNIVLLDTPGFLWPKLSPPECGYRLAVTGAIKDTVFEYEDVAMFALEFLMQSYPKELCERYRLDSVPGSAVEAMDMIGALRGCLRRGGMADLHKVSEIVLNELRSGAIGRISLETPEMFENQSPEE